MAWDIAAGTRERLALLAAIGPTLDPSEWGYHSHRDAWYYCGDDRQRRRLIDVTQEARESLALILERWHLDEDTALRFPVE